MMRFGMEIIIMIIFLSPEINCRRPVIFFPLSIVPYKETQQTDKKQQILPPSKKTVHCFVVFGLVIKNKGKISFSLSPITKNMSTAVDIVGDYTAGPP